MARTKLTHRQGKGFTKDLGWKLSTEGKRQAPRFLLGHDESRAELAALKLEQLWAIMVQEAEAASRPVAFGAPTPRAGAVWTEEGMWIARAIAKGQTSLEVPFTPHGDSSGGPHGEIAYAAYMDRLRLAYGSLIAFTPANPKAMATGQQEHKDVAERQARQARVAARIAQAPMPAVGSITLHQALDAFTAYTKTTKLKEGKLTAWGDVLTRTIERLKKLAPDVPLSLFGFTEVAAIRDKLAARPNSEKYERPIAIDTVKSSLKCLRLALRWVSRNPAFNWRLPQDVEVAWRFSAAGAMTHEEISGLRKPRAVYSVEQLATIYGRATDQERLLLLLALNCGFGAAELVTLRREEVDLTATPAKIARVRVKSRVFGSWALWPETVRALEWFAAERPAEAKDIPLVLVTAKGQPFDGQRVSNAWNRLHDHIVKDTPGHPWMPFKFLRKAAGQAIRDVAGGEVASVFLAHGQPTTDDLLGAYTNPSFAAVDAALNMVHGIMSPVFAAAPAAFTTLRRKGRGKRQATAAPPTPTTTAPTTTPAAS